jgi:hypothetical protein
MKPIRILDKTGRGVGKLYSLAQVRYDRMERCLGNTYHPIERSVEFQNQKQCPRNR